MIGFASAAAGGQLSDDVAILVLVQFLHHRTIHIHIGGRKAVLIPGVDVADGGPFFPALINLCRDVSPGYRHVGVHFLGWHVTGGCHSDDQLNHIHSSLSLFFKQPL